LESRNFVDVPRKETQLENTPQHGQPAADRARTPIVSGRWLLTALGVMIIAAIMCAWGSLCLLFWQGAWQLLYRPTSAVTRTPPDAGLAFDQIDFAVTDTGEPQLRGWWIPATHSKRPARYTVLYLHGRIGNLGDCVDQLASIHRAGVDVFAFDYRGYGQSKFMHPSEASWREDTNSALDYLVATRQIPVHSLVLAGSGLGANLALGVAAAHPQIAGVVLDSPHPAPLDLVFNDSRAQLVPAHLLFQDRYPMQEPAAQSLIPSLWMLPAESPGASASEKPLLDAYSAVTAPKTLVRLTGKDFTTALTRWLTSLHSHR
jgi:pimeloyl-ACP methyl ester carboxylesterase